MALCGSMGRAREPRRGEGIACLCVIACGAARYCVQLSRTDGALSVGCRTSSIQWPFWPPSGRSHLASLVGMSCITAAAVSLLQRWAARFAEGCTGCTGHKSPQRWRKRWCVLQWIYQYVWPIVHSLVLLVAHACVVVSLLVCLRPLASLFFC